ncbi:MAG: 2'-5' RNA ligase family protein [Bacteroidia bacterium]
MSNEELYFIAILPPPFLSEKINTIKYDISEKYHCKHALKSPPHITLIPPFKLSSKKEPALANAIQTFNSQSIQSFEIILNNYDVFLPKVVFINVINSPELIAFQKEVEKYFRIHFNIVKDLPPRPFHPHITIAFRDVKKHQTLDILNEVKQHFPIQEKFTLNNISLLKHNGSNWEVLV